METPALVVMAAGMGSRYGGLKQVEPVGAHGEVIIDYSVYDAVRAGFQKIIFVVTRAMEQTFTEIAGARIGRYADVSYVHQEMDNLPDGYAVPAGRVKPWGTAHAVLAARERVRGPFAVINADDYYGPEAFRRVYGWLTAPRPRDGRHHYCMVGYRIENTLTDNGRVTRGVCAADACGFLVRVTECVGLEKTPGGARLFEDGVWRHLPAGTLVSMNFWGFDGSFLDAAAADFPAFLDRRLPEDPLGCEYLLPQEVDSLLRRGLADVRVLESGEVWYGVTYREDRKAVVGAVAEMHGTGRYPTPLWAAAGGRVPVAGK
ncbi:MAG: nucleotidyltransferase [Oscillospiraceae bacterium]|jgi:hypothetical protein|nr:nucleotidyltransferase [Oscillospiraceae bacterium]